MADVPADVPGDRRVGRAVPGAYFRGRVTAVIAHLQPGEVVSYGEVAAEAGYPGAARAVGTVLATSAGLPWWRVVMADGRLAPGKEDQQGRLLLGEGVPVRSGRVLRPGREPIRPTRRQPPGAR